MDMFLEPETIIIPCSQHPVSRGAYWPSIYVTLSTLYVTSAREIFQKIIHLKKYLWKIGKHLQEFIGWWNWMSGKYRVFFVSFARVEYRADAVLYSLSVEERGGSYHHSNASYKNKNINNRLQIKYGQWWIYKALVLQRPVLL